MPLEETVRFEDLIKPIKLDYFFDQYWEKQPFCGSSGRKDTFTPLISLSGVERIISSLTSTDPDWIQVRKAGAPVLSPETYSTKRGFPDLAKIFDFFRTGYSITLSKLHKQCPPIGALCRNVEATMTQLGFVLSDRVGSHLYLTPNGSQAVLPHYDNLNVIAIQVEGVKNWRLYDMLEPFPVERQESVTPNEDLPSLLCEKKVEAGQVLYIPRGFYHEASAGAEYSMHVTLDIYTRTWADLVSKIAFGAPQMRRSLQFSDASRLNGQFTTLLQSLNSVDPHPIADRLVENLIEGLDPLPASGFDQIHRLTSVSLLSKVRRRTGAFPYLFSRGDQLHLLFPGGGFRGPTQIEAVFRFLCEATCFCVQELPVLADDSKIYIVTELIRDGFLSIVDP